MALSCIHIIGVDHLIQYENGIVPYEVRCEFRKFLVRCARKCSADCIAEEFSNEALEIYSSRESTARSVAESIGVRHIFCDPEKRDRARLGIPYFADLRDLSARILGASFSGPTDPVIARKVAKAASDLDRSFWHMRERFWLRALSSDGAIVAVFICGHEHVFRFRDLAFEGGYNPRIETPFWRDDLFSDYARLGIV